MNQVIPESEIRNAFENANLSPDDSFIRTDRLVRETEKAVQVEIEYALPTGDERETKIWLPKSQISKVTAPGGHDKKESEYYTVPAWLWSAKVADLCKFFTNFTPLVEDDFHEIRIGLGII